MEPEKKFSFGKNWKHYSQLINPERIAIAEASIKTMLGVEDLSGKTFLDIGSGSGLFSLAARRMGAKVVSFDFDMISVSTTKALKDQYFPGDDYWVVEQGSILDGEFVKKLGTFDIVYSWGVLHHTGAMYLALERAISCVNNGGVIYLALYNDQGLLSRIWWIIKYIYNYSPWPFNTILLYFIAFLYYSLRIIKNLLNFKIVGLIKEWSGYKKNRGMSLFHDWKDWVGGFPFEYVSFEYFVLLMEAKGFFLTNSKHNGSSSGCHEFVFKDAR
jgi:2-polyprenyl-6-hydroxyphenyl methylase/3-demethylubiquinone-9 3-methyltransferase